MRKRIACLWLEKKPVGAKLEELAEACGRFSPQIAIRENEAVFLEIGASLHLFSEAGFVQRARTLAQRLGWGVKIGIADFAAHALARARYPEPLPLEALLDFASPFARNAELQKKVAGLGEKLVALGVRDVPGFLALPSSALASRFGAEISWLAACARGEAEPAWPGFRPQEKILEKAEFEGADLEALVFVLKGVVDRAMARLRGRGERAAGIRLELTLVPWSSCRQENRELRVSLPVPQGSASGLLPILREHLDYELSRRPLEAPVQSLVFEILESFPGAGSQRDFFNRREEESESWDALLGRLVHALGTDRVFHAMPMERYLPERAWIKTIFRSRGEPERTDRQRGRTAPALESLIPAQSAPCDPNGVVPHCGSLSSRAQPIKVPPHNPHRPSRFGDLMQVRPSRMLGRPEPIRRKGATLIHSTGKRWLIQDWEGPERISGEWWEAAFNRDYYRVFTESGEKLWIYLDRGADAPGLYLHGYFD